jgi:hypothetical protein
MLTRWPVDLRSELIFKLYWVTVNPVKPYRPNILKSGLILKKSKRYRLELTRLTWLIHDPAGFNNFPYVQHVTLIIDEAGWSLWFINF